MQFVNLTDEQKRQIAAEQASKNIQPMPMEKGLQTEILPFSLNPIKLFGGVASNAAADVAGAGRDYRADISNAKSTDEIKSAVNNAISKFDNANPLIFGGDDVKKQKSEFLKNVSNSIRQSKLADGLSEYNGNLYLRKGDELFDLDDGLINQIGRVMRDNAGSMVGAALGYKKGGGFLQNMAGGALGAAGGSGVDHLNNSNYAGQEANLANAAKKMGEEALFSVAGDALIGAAAKYGKPALNLAGNVADKMPLLNLGKQVIESVPTANVKGAMKSAEAIAGDEAQAMLKNAAEVGGYKVDGGNITDLQLLNRVINKAKEISAKTAQKLHLDDAAAAINNTRGLDAEREKILSLALSDRKSAERLLNALRGDKSGRGARNLADLAQSDVSRIREMIGQGETTDLKDVVEQYYKTTKDSFGQAIDNLDVFKNGQKIKLSDDAIEQMKQEYSSNLNIFDKSSDKTRGVMEGFDSLKGRELGVKELNELRANYNKGLNDILNSDKNSYATKINFIKGKEILERAMDDLLGDDAARAYLRENLAQYKDFKGFERSPLFKAITNIESSAQDVMNAFRGLRDTQGGLYDKFISKLSPEQAQKFELAAIKDDFESALGKTGAFNVREILNGKELNEALQKTNFKSERAKEIVQEIDKLAKARGNLAEIFAALDNKFIMPTRFNKGIATTFSGASKTAFVNAVRQTALKYVPIIGNDAALEYHLREAAKAIKSGGTLKDYVKTMEKNGASKEQAKAFTDFIKEAAEQGSKLEQAGAKQVVEKQGSGASIGGLTANSNAHLGSGMVAGTLNSVDEDGNFSPERFAAGFLAGLVGSKAAAVGLRKMTPKLYNQILGAAEKMPQMANGNPRLLGKLYSNGKDVSLNSFAGEKAITANVGKLDQAKAMLEKGADEVEIWQKTGWFKDKDGAWKFEIGDGNAKLNPDFQSGGRLGELLEHEELFKAYPELKDVRVVKIGDETPGGAALSVKDAAQREKRGIYNVTYNNKTATLVRQDLQKIDDALILEKGSNKKGGAVHIKKHLDPGAQGAITQDEFLSVGKNIREYLQKYKEPFIDESGGRIYEWADGNGVKFRVVVYEKADGISASHPNSIISFYSNRNLKKPMEFRNPQVKYDVNLKEWHKDSAPITKNADGSPKVFYHGSNEGGLNIFKRQPEGSGYGFWFTASQKQANEYASAELIPGYLKITKPFEIEKINDYDTLKNIFGLSEKGFKEFQTERQIWRKAMEKLKVRGFRIADKDHLGFMLYDKNGEYVQTPNQMLVHDVHTLRDAGNDELAHFIYDKYYDRYVTGEVDVLAAVLNKNDYDVGKNFLRNKLKKAGYDGIKIDDNVIVVFDSAQIKHVKNDGNFSDSPNIYKSGAEGYYDPARNEIGLSDLGDKSTLIHEVQHAIQEIEDFARGGDFNTVWNVAAKNIEKRYESEIARLEKISNDAWEKYAPLQKEYIKLFDGGLKDTPEAQRLLKQMRAFSDEGYRADHEIRELRKAANAEQNAITEETLQENYRKIHGEAEARNVQNRLNLDGKAHPHETFDVNPNETIVSKEDGISYSRKIEEQRFAGTGRDKTTIMYATPHVGTGLAGGTLNAKDENGNFDAEKFAKGFIYGLFGSKITAATLKKTNPKLYDQIVKIAEGNASKEKISSFVNKLKQDELGKLLQKTVTNKDLSTKTKVEIIEAAKSRYAQEIK
nr:MAG TPA: Large polyvalent protein associated domain 23 [Caudoviricetes sp.]